MRTRTSKDLSRRRRFVFGLVALLLAGLLGVAVLASTAWDGNAGLTRVVYFVLPFWVLIFCAHLISGAAAVIGLVLLVPPFIRRISRTWLRCTISGLAIAAAVAAAVPWLLYFVGIGLNAASATYSRVTAENGESVLVLQSGFDRRDYAVYVQKSFFLYEMRGGWRTLSDVSNLESCTLTSGSSDLLLTCGTDSASVPR